MISVAACASQPSVPPATVAPSPTATPTVHLIEPASVDVVFRKLSAAGLRITPNNAGRGQSGEPVKRINASYRDWPLIISQFSSSAALMQTTRFDPSLRPARGEAPFRIVGLNILVEYGPSVTNGREPPLPDDIRRKAALTLVDVLHALLGPLQQSSVEPLPLPGASSGPSGSGPATSPKPATSPSS